MGWRDLGVKGSVCIWNNHDINSDNRTERHNIDGKRRNGKICQSGQRFGDQMTEVFSIENMSKRSIFSDSTTRKGNQHIRGPYLLVLFGYHSIFIMATYVRCFQNHQCLRLLLTFLFPREMSRGLISGIGRHWSNHVHLVNGTFFRAEIHVGHACMGGNSSWSGVGRAVTKLASLTRQEVVVIRPMASTATSGMPDD